MSDKKEAAKTKGDDMDITAHEIKMVTWGTFDRFTEMLDTMEEPGEIDDNAIENLIAFAELEAAGDAE